MCKNHKDGRFSVEHYYNNYNNPEVLYIPDPSVGISSSKVKREDHSLVFSFKRSVKNSSVTNYFDLNNPYYLLMAKGELSDGNKGKPMSF